MVAINKSESVHENDELSQRILDNSSPSIGKVIAAVMIDVLVVFGLTFVLFNYVLPSGISGVILNRYPSIGLLVSFLVYRLIFLLILKRTIGMIILRLKYLNGQYFLLDFTERFGIAFFISFNGIKLFNV